MNIEYYTKVNHKSYSNNYENDKKIKYLKNLITRILLSIILVISISIALKLDSENSSLINKYVFEDSIEFTKINKWYQDKIGTVIPDVASNNSSLVFSSEDLRKNEYENYLDGIKIKVDNTTPISLLSGGIVIFIGEKEGYGNTLIVQGNDGIDYWYGGISNINVNLYDYLEKDTLIGEATKDYLYIVLQEDGKYIDYEEYIS